MSDLHVHRVSTFEAFRALEPWWDRLSAAARLDSIFLTHAWLCDWWRVYGANKALFVLQVDTPTETVGFAPFAVARSRDGIRRLVFIGSGHIVPDHLDILALPECGSHVARAVWSHLWEQRDAWDLIDLNDLVAGSPLGLVITQTAAQAGMPAEMRMSSLSPYAVLPNAFDAYVNSLGDTTRKHLHYSRRRLLRDMPDAQFCRVGTASELENVFDVLVRLHQARWTARGESGSFARPGFRAFHNAAAHAGLANGSLRMYYLQLGTHIAAVFYCYRAGSRVCYYMSGFDERWNKYSPGTLLLAHVLEESIAEGAREFDFLQGVENYKEHWATHARENYRVLVAAPHLRGHLAWARQHSDDTLRRVAKRFIPPRTARTVRHLLQK